MDELVQRHLLPVVDKVPGLTAYTSAGDQTMVTTMGTLAGDEAPREAIWEIASITKVFTGTLLADMVIEGAFDLDDPIGLHLPAAVAERLPPPERQPTLEDLATHTAGLRSIPLKWLPGIFGPDPYADLTEAKVFSALGPRTRQPRKPRFRYTNYGMGLLGHIMTNVAGCSYEQLVQDRVLRPLGMANTGVGLVGADRLPVQGFKKGKKPTPPWTFGALEGAGALRSTVLDLALLAAACIDPPATRVGEALAMAHVPRRKAFPGHEIGLAWMTRTTDQGTAVWHNGGTYATSSFLAVDRGRSIVVIAFGNAGPRLVPPLDGPCWALFDEMIAQS